MPAYMAKALIDGMLQLDFNPRCSLTSGGVKGGGARGHMSGLEVGWQGPAPFTSVHKTCLLRVACCFSCGSAARVPRYSWSRLCLQAQSVHLRQHMGRARGGRADAESRALGERGDRCRVRLALGVKTCAREALSTLSAPLQTAAYNLADAVQYPSAAEMERRWVLNIQSGHYRRTALQAAST
jgi:hypothetical protein